MDEKTLLRGEFIGKQSKIQIHNNIINGIIIDETKNLLIIKSNDKVRKIIKKQAKITIDNVTINGEKIIKRSEERIKIK